MSVASDQRETSTDAARRIIEAASALFAERGYEGASVRDIAEAAGVSKANVFHHFASKWELYRAVVDSSAQLLESVLEQLAPTSDRVESTLAAFTGQHLKAMLSHSSAVVLFLRQLLAHNPSSDRDLARHVLLERNQLVESAIMRLIDLGHLRSDIDSRMLTMLLLGSNLVYFLDSLLEPEQRDRPLVDPQTFSNTVVAMLTQGIVRKDK